MQTSAMHITEILQRRVHISVLNFFRPGRSRLATLLQSMKELTPLKPSYVSVTYGAGGSTRQLTHELVERLHGKPNHRRFHITCAGAARDEIAAILEKYKESGIRNVMVLRGDPPKGRLIYSVSRRFPVCCRACRVHKKMLSRHGQRYSRVSPKVTPKRRIG